MTHPRKTLSDLLRLACDDGSTPSERASSFEAFRKRLERLPPDELHAVARAIEGERATAFDMATTTEDLRRAMEVAGARAVQKAEDEAICRASGEAVFDALMGLPDEVRCSEIGSLLGSVVLKVIGMQTDAVRSGTPPSDTRKLEQALAKLGKAVEETSSVREQGRQQALERIMAALFDAEPEQPGADAIARKIRWRAADVREHLKGLVETGQVEAIGRGRARRHRHLGRVSRPTSGRGTDNGPEQ